MSSAHNTSLSRPTRRRLLAALSAGTVLASGVLGTPFARAQDAAAPATPADAPPAEQPALPPAAEQTPFSFDILTDQMREASGKPPVTAQPVDGFISKLDYDSYQQIRFNPEQARFADVQNTRFKMQAFHLGWLFREPVLIYQVVDGQSRLMSFTSDDFIYEREARKIVPEHVALPGVSGFRLHSPINRPDIFDEIAAFQGASYFRALGRGSLYGLSARGLAVNTAVSVAEEFPRFSRFWIDQPQPGSETITVYAAMESASLTGAYRFVITPGKNTVMEVTARLFFRTDIKQLGVAPLTSMFLYSDRNRAAFDDFRPQVHDSDGLGIERANGELLWRPLNNPPHLASSYFTETAPRSFGLYQRDRDFDQYQDGSSHYELRPSLKVEPLGDWGAGMVRLVEIPSKLEVNDNIVAFWIPKDPIKAGETREFSYRLTWGNLPPDPFETRAHVLETRAGIGGVSGNQDDSSRKFVVDFAGGLIAGLPPEAVSQLNPVVTVNNGKIVTQSFSKLSGHPIWRLVLDVSAEEGSTVELSAHLAGYGTVQSETWVYQWIKA